MAYAMVRGELHEEGKAPRRPRRDSRMATADRSKNWKGTAAGRDWFAGLDGVT